MVFLGILNIISSTVLSLKYNSVLIFLHGNWFSLIVYMHFVTTHNLSEPENFSDQLDLVPHVREGQQAALEINAVKAPEIAHQLDLQEGDVIVSVNGVSATDHSQLSQALEQTKYTQTVAVELIREGERHYKSYLLAGN